MVSGQQEYLLALEKEQKSLALGTIVNLNDEVGVPFDRPPPIPYRQLFMHRRPRVRKMRLPLALFY